MMAELDKVNLEEPIMKADEPTWWGEHPDTYPALKEIAGIHHTNMERDRVHRAEAKVNPRVAREAQLKQVYDRNFTPMHQAWQQAASADEHKGASLPSRWRNQAKFISEWHDQNPEHYHDIVDELHGAHAKGEKYLEAHRQEEGRKAQQANLGGGAGEMTVQEAAAHMGHKAEGAGEDDMAAVSTKQAAPVAYAAAHPEAAKRVLESKRFQDIPDEDVELERVKGKAPLLKLPELESDVHKQHANKLAGEFSRLMSPKFIDSVKEGVGTKGADVDESRVQDAALRAMWKAVHEHNPLKRGLKAHIESSMRDAVRNEIIRQHTEGTGAALKREAKQVEADPAKRTEGLVQRTPEEQAALKAKLQAAYDAMTPEQKQRHQAVSAAKMAIKKPEGQ